MNALQYLLQVNLSLILFYGFYMLLLRNETFFRLNRTYLVSTALLSFFIPLLQSGWIQSLLVTQRIQHAREAINSIVYSAQVTQVNVSALRESQWTILDVIAVLYVLGFAAGLIKLFWRLTSFHITPSKAYSFFKKIKVDEDVDNREVVYKHEEVHAVQWHSADVLFFEIVAIICWFNPMVYGLKKAIKSIHEFIADEETAKQQPSKEAYATLLVSQAFGIEANSITNGFNRSSLLKRRIIMLHKNKSKKTAILKYGLSAPLFILLMILSSATIEKDKIEEYAGRIAEVATNVPDLITEEPTYAEATYGKLPIAPPAPPVNRVINAKNNIELVTAANALILDKTTDLRSDEKQPMVVLDGKVIDNIPADFNFANADEKEYAKILRISPSDIRSITVLKDQAAIEKFGEKGKNGVLLITTKMMSEKPLIILDGKPVEHMPADFSFTRTDDKELSKILGISASDIHDITVLKDKEAIKKYGEQAKGGVLIINTKRALARGTDDDPIFESVDVLPKFPGGDAAWIKFISQNYKYPSAAQQQGVSGRVYVSFVVEKDGSLTDIKVVRDLGLGTGEEAKRVLQMSPKWQPGIQKGVPVRVAYVMPIVLNLTPAVKK